MLAISFRDNLLLASRISIPIICRFSSRSTVTPSSISILSSTSASLSRIYRASAFLSYSIFKSNHLHPFNFFTAVITVNSSLFSLYVTLKNLSEDFIHAFILPSIEDSRYSGLFTADSTSSSVILCLRILFFACLVYFIVFTDEMISDNILSCNKHRQAKENFNEDRWFK